ncbi:hypothetical protein FRC08_018265 [Ceratobasidium sp. 394]|nr:hypothetical protein FRC08_018265 [Ceratobasidium sp. 394]KAG9091550.1 hypothetical protein FS749_016443 [Ceratobasidium sp. UAMH 11750]
MFLSSRSRSLNVPIPPTVPNVPLVKSPASYTSPETPKPMLFGNGAPPKKEVLSDADYSRMDPDDMLARYSVSEIRVIRARLLADADGKREELRQMVGERYRDLLHASTAITNMAGTSERVVGELVEMRESCCGILQLDESPKARHRSALNGKGTKAQEDAHLKTLQILSAHLKLLLDAPEHLWRWLEKKQFLHAAWLFLLARTVHRKLSKSVDEEESDGEENEGGDINWSRHGIDITEQFPIAARQWEAIGQFRPQIVHKATQALREAGASHKEVAETLIAILLLDALSSARTRSLFLSQRGKTLAILLNPPLSVPRRPISPNRDQNRKATAALLSPASPARSLPSPSIQLLKTPVPASVESTKAERKAVKEVVKSFRAVFSLVGGTVATVRAIYGSGGFLAKIISEIQTDVPTPATLPATASQPYFPSSSNLQQFTQPPKSLTTPQILQSLPSSSLLLRFLPSSIVGYAPYISTESNDPGGAESNGTEEELKAWMDMALEALAAPAKSWLGKLDSVRAVWTVRSSVINGIASLEGTVEVKSTLERAVEAAFAARVGEVWERRLETIEITVGSAISKTVTVLAGATGEEDGVKADLDPLAFVYSAELPPVQADASGDFRRFEINLVRRANRRTPTLDSLISEMEEAARELWEELKIISGEKNTNEVAARLTSTYQPRAGETCMRVVAAVSGALDDANSSDSAEKANTVVFVGRLANALASSSSFIKDLSCSQEVTTDATSRLKSVHQESLRTWCDWSAESALRLYQPALEASPSADVNISLILRPSNHLMSALRSLMISIDSLGLTLEQLRAEQVTWRLLAAFKDLLAAGLPVEHAADQVVWDLMFVREMQRATRRETGSEEAEQRDTSDDIINSHLQKTPEETQKLVATSVKNQLYRSQLLFSTLLDAGVAQAAKQTQSRTQSIFLPLGVPPAETDFRPALELVKPGQRFGMLPIAPVAHK